jgi:hypothetical protein
MTLTKQPRLESGGMTEWMPIETAPKDGSVIVLARWVAHPLQPTLPLTMSWITKGCWSLKFKNWSDGLEPSGLNKPTHWIKLSPPKRTQKEETDAAIYNYAFGKYIAEYLSNELKEAIEGVPNEH